MSKKPTPYEQFNIQVPETFPEDTLDPRAAKALVKSECWTDANPMLNLSSFVTTFLEPEAREIFADGSFRNFADPDMYPHTKDTEAKCVKWLYGFYFRKMNPVILAGACAGARNSTPAMKGISDQSQSEMPALGYPVPYALTSMIVLILGYIAMVIS